MTRRPSPGPSPLGEVGAAGPIGLARLLQGAFVVESALAMTCLALMTAVVFADVLGREAFDQGIAGAQRLGVYAFVVAGFLGLPLATARGSHLRPAFADAMVPPRLTGAITRSQHMVAAVISVGLAWFGLSFALQTLALQEVSPVLEIPIGLVQLVLPYAFASSGARHAIFALYPALIPPDSGEA